MCSQHHICSFRAGMFKERYETGQLHNRIVKHTTLNFTRREMADEVRQFFEDNFNPAERTVQQGGNSIDILWDGP